MSEILNGLSLNTNEEKVYLFLLSSGQMSSAEIAQHFDLKISDVETNLQSLTTKNLIFLNPGIVKKYSAIYPLVALSAKAKGTLDTIHKMGNEINAYAEQRFDSLDKIVENQKISINNIVTQTKDENRKTVELATGEVSNELDKLIEEISQILNSESRAIHELASSTSVDITKHSQETSEKAGNIVSSSVSDIVNSLGVAHGNITKSFEDACTKVETATSVMDNSLQASLDNNLTEFTKSSVDNQNKLNNAVKNYNTAAQENMEINSQTITDNYSSIIDSVNGRLGLHDKETNQILEERIRNIAESMNEMNEEFVKLIREKLLGVRRDYQQMMESLTRNVEQLFTETNSQLQTLIAAKTRTNSETVNNLFKLMKENLDKNAEATIDEIKNKENRVHTELKSTSDISKRKMAEVNDKLLMEITNNFNKARADFETNKTNMSGIISRAKEDITNHYEESKDNTLSSILKEFKNTETSFTNVGSKILDDIRALNNLSETKSIGFIKDTEERANAAIAKIEMPSKTLLNKGKQVALRAIQEQSSFVNKATEQTQTAVEDTIISETSNVKTQFKGFGDKFKESNKTIERLLANMELTYRELITKVKDISRPALNTTTIIGRNAILLQMKEILSRVKSTVTLIYPDTLDIPVDDLLKSNPRTRIIVISDFDQFKNADLIKRMMSKENIQLKSLTVGSTSKPYFAIGRDAEEGLVATLDDSGDVIGITSKSQAFVEMISSEIINGIITPKTKRVTLQENE
ncbi:MAG TPA: helix-turn-helix domain-containing protein [candidate division Zixibacteria bacterium]|nr:helix-turn-helix domain-containing protein [candidate division Zixibacteria bacterium]